MGFYWEGLGFSMEMGSGGHFDITCSDAKGEILDSWSLLREVAEALGNHTGAA